MTEPRIIKKYPNRRLYDTVHSKYITIEDVRDLVLGGVEFCIKDQKSGEDITRSILLQIISEQEHFGQPILTTHAMLRIIGLYGDALQGLAGSYLEKSLTLLTEQQKLFQSQLNDAVKSNPITAITELTQRNLDLLKKMQEQFFKASRLLESERETAPPDQPGDKR